MKLRQVSKDILALRLELLPRHDDAVSRLIRTIAFFSSFQVRSLCSIAQIFCFIHLAKGDTWFAGVEETLWGISFAFLAFCSIFLLMQYKTLQRYKVQRQKMLKDKSRNEAFLLSLLVVSVFLSAYTLLYHCDILFQISIHEHKHGKAFRPFLDGLRIAISYKKVTRRFEDWKFTYDWQGTFPTYFLLKPTTSKSQSKQTHGKISYLRNILFFWFMVFNVNGSPLLYSGKVEKT